MFFYVCYFLWEISLSLLFYAIKCWTVANEYEKSDKLENCSTYVCKIVMLQMNAIGRQQILRRIFCKFHGRFYSGKLLLSCQTELRLTSAESLYWSLLAHFVSSSRAKTVKLLRRTKSFFSDRYRRTDFFYFPRNYSSSFVSLVSVLAVKFCYIRKVSHYRKKNISLLGYVDTVAHFRR